MGLLDRDAAEALTLRDHPACSACGAAMAVVLVGEFDRAGEFYAVCARTMDALGRSFAIDHSYALLGPAALASGDYESTFSLDTGFSNP